MARFVRVEELLFAAADAFPGLVPKRVQIAAEEDTLQRDKDGLEIDQGILISHVLAHDQSGRHLCHAMLLPRPESQEALAKLATDDALDLGAVRLERHGRAIHLIMSNPRFLNAEDQTTIDAMEVGVDVAILDPESDIAVLRGGPVDHPKYAGFRVPTCCPMTSLAAASRNPGLPRSRALPSAATVKSCSPWISSSPRRTPT